MAHWLYQNLPPETDTNSGMQCCWLPSCVTGWMVVGVSGVRNVFIFTAVAVHEEWCLLNCLPFSTRYTQKNGAVSKGSKKFISHLARAQRTPSAAAIVQVSHALPAVRFSCVLRGGGASFQDGVAAWCVFSKPCTKLTLHCNHRSGHLKTKHTESLFLLRRHLGNWPRGPAVSKRSVLLVAHEKLGQLPLLTVYVVPV